jgi:hypothetical protein
MKIKLSEFKKLVRKIVKEEKAKDDLNFLDDFDDMVDEPFDFNNPKYSEKISKAASKFDKLIYGKDSAYFLLDGNKGIKTPNVFVNYILNLGDTLNPNSTSYYKDFNKIISDINKQMENGMVMVDNDIWIVPKRKK